MNGGGYYAKDKDVNEWMDHVTGLDLVIKYVMYSMVTTQRLKLFLHIPLHGGGYYAKDKDVNEWMDQVTGLDLVIKYVMYSIVTTQRLELFLHIPLN